MASCVSSCSTDIVWPDVSAVFLVIQCGQLCLQLLKLLCSVAIYAYTFASYASDNTYAPQNFCHISDRRMGGCGTPVVQFRHQKLINRLHSEFVEVVYLSVAYRGEFWSVQTPSEIPKALQNRAKTNPIVKT